MVSHGFSSRIATVFLMVVIVLLPISCRIRPEDALLPVPAAAGTKRLDLLVATTRKPHPDRATIFGSERADRLHFARFAMGVPGTHAPGKIEWPRSRPPDAASQICVLDSETLDRKAFSAELKDATSQGQCRRPVLVIVHGYNTGFALSLLRSTQILVDSELEVAPVLFSWASRGKLSGYGYDRESASLARDGLDDLLRHLDGDPQVGSVSILAHSMGTWLTMETLRQMGIARRGGMEKIRDIVLAAPDIDPEEFRAQWQRAQEGMKQRSLPRITIYASRDDMALKASASFWGNEKRLGLLDPNASGFPAWMVQNGVTVIDITRLRAGDPISHSKYANAPGLAREIGRLIASGQLDPLGTPGVGERLARGATDLSRATATTIAGVATAPLAATDDAGRARLAERIADFFQRDKRPGTAGER